MRTPDAIRHIAAIAPLVTAGLVDRVTANNAVAFWDSINWKDGKIAKGKWYPEEVVKPAIPAKVPVMKPQKAKKSDSKPVYHPEIVENSLFVESKEKRKKWTPTIDEIY